MYFAALHDYKSFILDQLCSIFLNDDARLARVGKARPKKDEHQAKVR